MTRRPTVYIETFGCQMNVLDSELVQGQLEALGYGFVSDAQSADVVLLNTCSVRELSEQKVWSMLGRLAAERAPKRHDRVVGVLGCMAEREGRGILKRMPHVDVLCGPSELDQVPNLIHNALNQRAVGVALSGHSNRRTATLNAAEERLEALDLSRAFNPDGPSRAQAYVRITRGCNKFCSFCVVPFTRGPEMHRAPESIIEEVRRLVDQGVLEVTLLGQTVNHYAHRDGARTTSFADLLFQVHEAVPDLPRLRFITSYPRDFTDDALDAMAACPRICKYLHIPAQSGSNRMLRLMNRGYTVEAYEALLARARARMPDIRLAGDMIVGFPTETEADHEASVGLLQRARYKGCFVFKYSPRPGTVAIRRHEDDVPDDVKRRRNLELLDVQAEISRAHNRARIGTTVEVLVEGTSKLRAHRTETAVRLGWEERKNDTVRLVGRTEGDEIVAFDGSASSVGSRVPVVIEDVTNLTLLGRACDADPHTKPSLSRAV